MVNKAYAFDEKSRNSLWQDAIQKEMDNVKIAIQTISENKKPSNGFQYVKCHMVFDIEKEDFWRKACIVIGGHMTHTPDTNTYSSVDTREIVHSALTITALHDLEVKAAEILNTYVMAPICKKIWTILGPELGDDAGKSALIVRALYGLKSVSV